MARFVMMLNIVVALCIYLVNAGNVSTEKNQTIKRENVKYERSIDSLMTEAAKEVENNIVRKVKNNIVREVKNRIVKECDKSYIGKTVVEAAHVLYHLAKKDPLKIGINVSTGDEPTFKENRAKRESAEQEKSVGSLMKETANEAKKEIVKVYCKTGITRFGKKVVKGAGKLFEQLKKDPSKIGSKDGAEEEKSNEEC